MQKETIMPWGEVVSMLVFHSVDPSSNPAEDYNFSVNFLFEKNTK